MLSLRFVSFRKCISRKPTMVSRDWLHLANNGAGDYGSDGGRGGSTSGGVWQDGGFQFIER